MGDMCNVHACAHPVHVSAPVVFVCQTIRYNKLCEGMWDTVPCVDPAAADVIVIVCLTNSVNVM